MIDPVSVVRDGHRTYLKWHRARRTGTDPVFTGSRIVEGMSLGASVEVDLVVHGDGGFAVLHDTVLGRESTGTGPVVEKSADQLRTLRLRDNHGAVIDEPVMLLDDLAQLIGKAGVRPGALLQLDYKEDAAALNDRTIANFAASVTSIAASLILSSGDADAVQMLTDATSGIHVGYDPCHEGALDRLALTKDFAGFVRDAVDASPRAEMIYLAYPLVLEAAAAGFDLVDAFHQQGRRVDAYTIQRADEGSLPIVRRLLELKVDQITTDDAEGLAALIGDQLA